MKRVLAIVIALAVTLSALIAFRIHVQRAALTGPAGGSGVVESEGVDLSARIGARVARVLVPEGEHVAAGAVVLELECDEPRARLAETEARLAAARAQALAADAQAQAARGQSMAARATIGAQGAQVSAIDTQRELASRDSERLESMGEHASLSSRDRARAMATNLAEQAEAARAAQLATRRQAAASTLQAQAAAAQAAAASESVRAIEALLVTARIVVAECAIRAPNAGVVERVYYDPGELVALGATVARVIDPSTVRATFYLSNADIDEARVGMAAVVEADAYPGSRFSGTVRRVGLEAEFTPRNVQTRSDRDRLVFPVEVRVKQRDGRLRAGMPVTVTLTKTTTLAKETR